VPDNPFPTVSVAPDPPPSDTPFVFEVTCDRGFSADAPALFAATLENASEREQTVGLGPAGPLSAVWSCDGRLALVPRSRQLQQYAFGTDEQIVPDRPVDGCWQTLPGRLIRHDVLRWARLSVGGHAAAEYVLLDDGTPDCETGPVPGDPPPGTAACLPAGEYRFEESYPPPVDGEADWVEFRWGITVTLGDG
jgi:hypothetical protein